MALSWGIPTIKILNADPNATASDYAKTEVSVDGTEIVEESTSLETEDGDVMEALVEGGSREDVKYKDSTYTLSFNVRKTDKRTMPFESVIDWNTGNVDGEYKIEVVPEIKGTWGVQLTKCKVKVKPTFSSTEGLIYEYTCESLSAGSSTKNLIINQKPTT